MLVSVLVREWRRTSSMASEGERAAWGWRLCRQSQNSLFLDEELTFLDEDLSFYDVELSFLDVEQAMPLHFPIVPATLSACFP